MTYLKPLSWLQLFQTHMLSVFSEAPKPLLQTQNASRGRCHDSKLFANTNSPNVVTLYVL